MEASTRSCVPPHARSPPGPPPAASRLGPDLIDDVPVLGVFCGPCAAGLAVLPQQRHRRPQQFRCMYPDASIRVCVCVLRLCVVLVPDALHVWPLQMIYDLPGGLEGVQSMVAAFQARGVRVLWACFPWDHGSRNTGRPGERNGLRSTDRNISLN
jgi:hypothetical protein